MPRRAFNVCLMGVFAFALPLLCLSQSCSNSLQNPSLDSTLSTGGLSFSFALYKLLQSQNNVFFSPYSVRVALAMTAVGARGSTLSQMNSALQLTSFQNQNQANQAFLDLSSSLCSNGFYSLNTANRIFVEQTFPLLQTFVDTLKQYYLAEAVNVNFLSNSSAVTTEINNWVANQTENTITDLFTPGTLDSSTIMAIVNAIYFRGTWAVQFNSSLTQNQSFVLSPGNTVQVPMMRLTTEFNYTYDRDLKSQILQLNYTGNRLATYVILPQQNVNLSVVQNKLNAQTFNSFRNSLEPQRINVSIPKFSLKYEAELSNYLQSLGMNNLFGSGANLSGIAGGSGLFVSNVVHQAFVQVDEQGTTAAAATGVVLSKSLPPPPEIFFANRPFIFIIYDLLYNQILFIGHLSNPSN